jgi:integrase
MKLVSEGLSSDGSFNLHQLLLAANERLETLGKRGKRAKLKRSGSSVTLQFNFNGQKNPGINCTFTKKGIQEAEKIAELVTVQLSANSFTWNWFNGLIGKDTKTEKPKDNPTCNQLIREYKIHWFKENTKLKNPEGSWYLRFKDLENNLIDKQQELSDSIIRTIIENTQNDSSIRRLVLQALTAFLDYFEISEYNNLIKSYKSKNNPTQKIRNVPSDEKIKTIFKIGFEPKNKTPKIYLHRLTQWQFLYGLLAVYGLRIHEAWNIANWDKPVVLTQGDWVTLEDHLEEDISKYEQYRGDDILIPAILDPTNKDKILCIKHNTKTGFRMSIPLSPVGENWLEAFNLLQPLNLPDIENPLSKSKGKGKVASICTILTCQWFRGRGYGFTPHDLRHAYNHRGHQIGYNPTLLAKSLGHSLNMNSTTYLKTMPNIRGLQMMKDAIASEKEKQSELEKLKAENEFLKQENEKLKTEVTLYKSLLEQVKLK